MLSEIESYSQEMGEEVSNNPESEDVSKDETTSLNNQPSLINNEEVDYGPSSKAH